MATNAEGTTFVPASDRSLLVSFGGFSFDTHQRVAALVHRLATDPVSGVSNIHPAYCSVLVVFDPLATDHAAVRTALARRIEDLVASPHAEPRTVDIPVCYGGSYGPDLDGLAQFHGIVPERVIELHSSAAYIACFIGFVPGFAYLAGLPRVLTTPRLAAPRRKVPAGSVGIAGGQTGIYPFETPGGWRLIGRTPLAIFRADREPMSLVELGDAVRFVPIDAGEFEKAAR